MGVGNVVIREIHISLVVNLVVGTMCVSHRSGIYSPRSLYCSLYKYPVFSLLYEDLRLIDASRFVFYLGMRLRLTEDIPFGRVCVCVF